jgi:FlaA1/EpsC-like NDP-sugar epimerase
MMDEFVSPEYLGRARVSLKKVQSAQDYLRGKRVLVTGACGTVGRHLTRKLVNGFKCHSLVGLDHNESELAFLEEEYKASRADVRFLLADMRDLVALSRETRRVDVIFHTAAYKHVHVCERSPLEAIQTNVLGVQNVIQSALDNGVEKVIFTSSDKAVNPTNVMGTSKLLGERLITAAAAEADQSGGCFMSVRFGNVLGSRGSVIPIFREQIRQGGPVTLTHSAMTRFIMSLDEAVNLVIEAVVLGKSGDVLITKMPVIRIADLAQVMIDEYAPLFGRRPRDIEVMTIGPRPGEKLYEELMNEEETRRALELARYYVVRPPATVHVKGNADYDGLLTERVVQPYNSNNAKPLLENEIAEFLHRSGLVKVRAEWTQLERETVLCGS